MSPIVLILGLSIVLVCLYGLASPAGYVGLAKKLIARIGIWGATALRLVLALSLWFAADESSTPLVFKMLGVITMLGALMIPFVGLARIEAMIQWASEQSPWFLRSTCSLGVGLGGFLIWSILAASNAAH